MTWRAPGLPVHWQHFFGCVVMLMLLPWLPLGIEWLYTDAIAPRTILLFVAMYAMSIGVSSTSILMFIVGVVVGLVYCAGYGGAVGQGKAVTYLVQFGPMCALFIAMMHAIERFNRHVVDRAPFFEFVRSLGVADDATTKK